MEEMNKVYTIHKGKVYESFNMIWIMSKVKWTKTSSFHFESNETLAKMKEELYQKEADPNKKYAYRTSTDWAKYSAEEKKRCFIIFINRKKLNFTRDNETRYFVSEQHYLNRTKHFLRSQNLHVTYERVDAKLTLKRDTETKYIYEVKKNSITGADTKNPDLVLPEIVEKGWGGFYFDKFHLRFINSSFSPKVKAKVLPENGKQLKPLYNVQKSDGEMFLTQVEYDIDKIYADYTNLLNI